MPSFIFNKEDWAGDRLLVEARNDKLEVTVLEKEVEFVDTLPVDLTRMDVIALRNALDNWLNSRLN